MLQLLITILWAAAGVVLCVGGVLSTPFAGLLVAWTWIAVGLAVIVANFWLARRKARRSFSLCVAVATAVAGVGILASEGRLERLGDDLRFAAARPKYEAIVQRLVAGGAPAGERDYLGVEYEVDPGPPRRVAFRLPNSVIDNWCAVIYDQTGSLKALTPSMQGLFGGDLVGCSAIDEVFFRCCFT